MSGRPSTTYPLRRDLRRSIGSEGSGEIAYSADTRPGKEIVDVARDADLLVIEGTLPRPERTGLRGHLTPEEAASTRGRRAPSAW